MVTTPSKEPLISKSTRKYWTQKALYYQHNKGKAVIHVAALIAVVTALAFVANTVFASSSSSSPAASKGTLASLLTFFSPSAWFKSEFETIFVSLASYRDPQCSLTVKDMYMKAEHPERIYVGIYQQHGEKEVDCLNDLDQYEYVPLENIKIERVHFSEGKGPTVARYFCSLLFDNQDYFFQLDSHSRFLKHWDTVMVEEAHNVTKQIGHPRAILSHYPLEYHVEDDSIPPNANEVTTRMCTAKFNTDGIIQPYAGIIKTPELYEEAPFAAAGFMWGPGSMVIDTPYDPDLPFLFHGEELLYSVRAHAKGYRIFNPVHATVFHFYNRPTFPKIWVDAPDYYAVSKQSVDKVKRTLMLADPADMNGPKATFSPPVEDVMGWYSKWGFDIVNKTERKWC